MDHPPGPQDLAKKKIINCWYVKTLVLDEADVMLSEAWMLKG